MENEKPYRLPDPEKTPEAFLVLLYKTLKSIEYNDRGWDKIYFARCMKRTKQLLDNVGGDVRKAAQCLRDLKERFESDGLSWTIETVVQYCFEWRSEFEKRSDRDCFRALAGAYASAGLQLFAPEKPQIALLPPECKHIGLKQIPGASTACPECHEEFYTPKPGEMRALIGNSKPIAKAVV